MAGLITRGLGIGTPLVLHGLGGLSITTAGSRIRRAVLAALAADANVSTMVGARVYPINNPAPSTLPALAYEMVSDTPGYVLAGADGTSRAAFRFTAVTKTLADGESLAEAVRLLFDDYTGTLSVAGGGSSVTVIETWRDDEDDAPVEASDGTGRPYYLTVTQYVFRYRKPAAR